MTQVFYYSTNYLGDLYSPINQVFVEKLSGRTVVENGILKISGGMSWKFNCNSIFGDIRAITYNNRQYLCFNLAAGQLAGARLEALSLFILEEITKKIGAFFSKESYFPNVPLKQNTTNQSSTSSLLENIEKLKSLLDSGAITQEEYDDLKQKCLNNQQTTIEEKPQQTQSYNNQYTPSYNSQPQYHTYESGGPDTSSDGAIRTCRIISLALIIIAFFIPIYYAFIFYLPSGILCGIANTKAKNAGYGVMKGPLAAIGIIAFILVIICCTYCVVSMFLENFY